MQYTEEQYEYLQLCANGLIWEWFEDEYGDEILRFLMDEGLVISRVDIQDNLLCLSQKGKAALSEQAERKKQHMNNAPYQSERNHIGEATQEANDNVKTEKDIAKKFGERLHEYAVSIAPVAVTRLLEHWGEAVDLIKKLVRALGW